MLLPQKNLAAEECVHRLVRMNAEAPQPIEVQKIDIKEIPAFDLDQDKFREQPEKKDLLEELKKSDTLAEARKQNAKKREKTEALSRIDDDKAAEKIYEKIKNTEADDASLEKTHETQDPEAEIQKTAKTLSETQKLNPAKMERAEIYKILKNFSTAQIRTLEKTNPNLLFKACFEKNGDELIFNSGGIRSLEMGVGLRVLPADNHLAINGKSAYRLESGVFGYADGSGYAGVRTGEQKITIEKTPPPADALAKLNTKTKDYYAERDLNNFLRAYGGEDINSNPEKLKKFGEMLASGNVEGIPKDLQASLQNKVEKNVKDQAELAKVLKMTDKEFSEVMGNGGNPAIAFEYLKNLGGLNLTDVQIAGLVGNLQQESGKNLNTEAIGDNGTSYGIAQWHNERWDALKTFAKNHDSEPSSLKTQLGFLVHELKNGESAALAQLQRAQTVEEAATAFNRHFERSVDKPGDARHNQRINYAQNIYADSREDPKTQS